LTDGSPTLVHEITLLADKTCAIVPDGCRTASCATTKTPCIQYSE